MPNTDSAMDLAWLKWRKVESLGSPDPICSHADFSAGYRAAVEDERLKSEQRKIALDWFKADVTRSARTEGDAKNEV